MKKVLARLDALERKLIKLDVNQTWLMRILIGAAGLGFIEKCVGWIMR